MHLKEPAIEPPETGLQHEDLQPEDAEGLPVQTYKTVQEALDLLESIKGSILKELTRGGGDGTLAVPLNTMDILQTEKNKTAHVLWIGPKRSIAPTTLDRVAGMSHISLRARNDRFIRFSKQHVP